MRVAPATAEVPANIEAGPIHRAGDGDRRLDRHRYVARSGRIRVAPVIIRLQEDAITLRRKAGKECGGWSGSISIVYLCYGAGARVHSPIAPTDAHIPGVGDIVTEQSFKHGAVAVGPQIQG